MGQGDGKDPAGRRYLQYRLLQGLLLLMMLGALLLAALALPLFQSAGLGWLFLALCPLTGYGVHWAGRHADRRNGQPRITLGR